MERKTTLGKGAGNLGDSVSSVVSPGSVLDDGWRYGSFDDHDSLDFER